VIFRQRRYGLYGEEIIVYKFRSMTVTDDGKTIVQASKNDQRVTPIGASCAAARSMNCRSSSTSCRDA
jgi:putative colanic acid biosynthesis UDP-glucose lipid carrier transferase